MEYRPRSNGELLNEYIRTKNPRYGEAYNILESFLKYEAEFMELYTDVFDNSICPAVLRQDASFELQMYFSKLGFNALECFKNLKSYNNIFDDIGMLYICADIESILKDLKIEEV